MSDIDPLIKREMQWMAVNLNEDRDLSPVIFAKVRRARIRNSIFAVLAVLVISLGSIGIYEAIRNSTSVDSIASGAGVTGENSATQPEIIGITSDYPITWEQSVGDLSAISAAGGIGDTLGGLTAVGLKVSWERCGKVQCPMTWILSLENRTADLISTAPSLAVFLDYLPLSSASRPTTVLPGGNALLVYTFPEFQESMEFDTSAKWQWNWYLAQLR